MYILSHDSHLLADYTSDRDILAQVVSNADLEPLYQGNDPINPINPFSALAGPGRPATTPQLDALAWHKQISDSIHTIEKIADNLARRPGRKALVWLSAGFPIIGYGRMDYRPAFEQLVNRLNRADVGLYTVDARGLVQFPYRGGFPDTLLEIAQRTGGRAFADRNDLDEATRSALEDQRLGYTLAYRLPDRNATGAHDIRVAVKRAGVRLRYRESYQLMDESQ